MGKVNLYNVYSWNTCQKNLTAGEVEKLTGMSSARVSGYTKCGPCTYMKYQIERSGEKLLWSEQFRKEWQEAVKRVKGENSE